MSVARPTFHESWHRVMGLRPRLRVGTRVVRQTSRGKVWQVVEDASGSQFFRMSEAAWGFVGLLDGRMTVAEAWELCQERIGDAAPTQGEVIQLLGQLSSSNLLHAEVMGDAESLFRRKQKRIGREVRSWLQSVLFLRIPLWDPNLFLDRWVMPAALIFSPIGAILWIALVVTGAVHLAGREKELMSEVSGVLAPENLIWLYLTYAAIKGVHELGHAFACKVFGRRSSDPAAGSVHTIGVMFLVFMPVPYVDASSSWLLRRKHQRIIVAGAGILVELAIAAAAAIVWSRSAPGTLTNAIAFNAIFLAGVSTLIFNGNPLMRYDGYYILADLIEIPNLAKRSQDYLAYVVKRYAWGLEKALSPAYTLGERLWLAVYGVASAAYRWLLVAVIALFIVKQEYVLGGLVLGFMAVAWVAVPLGKILRYVVADPELTRVRRRAVWSSAAALLLVGAMVLVVPVPDHRRAEGVVEPARFVNVYASTEGRIVRAMHSGDEVREGGPALIEAENADWTAEEQSLRAERTRLETVRRQALERDAAEVRRVDAELAALADREAWVQENLSGLNIQVPMAGVWIAPAMNHAVGRHMQRGEALGVVADLNSLIVRATADQRLAAALIDEAKAEVEVRAKGRPSLRVLGRIERVLPAGQSRLPSPALGAGAGGATVTDQTEMSGEKAAEAFFEVRIVLEDGSALRSGQLVAVRFEMPWKPIGVQLWRMMRQTLQERFRLTP